MLVIEQHGHATVKDGGIGVGCKGEKMVVRVLSHGGVPHDEDDDMGRRKCTMTQWISISGVVHTVEREKGGIVEMGYEVGVSESEEDRRQRDVKGWYGKGRCVGTTCYISKNHHEN